LLAGDFEAQCRQTFRNIEKTLTEAGAKLSDMVNDDGVPVGSYVIEDGDSMR
jgi:enamine deaminase RidA (YjgF/YER057c/UK114 family)